MLMHSFFICIAIIICTSLMRYFLTKYMLGLHFNSVTTRFISCIILVKRKRYKSQKYDDNEYYIYENYNTLKNIRMSKITL